MSRDDNREAPEEFASDEPAPSPGPAVQVLTVPQLGKPVPDVAAHHPAKVRRVLAVGFLVLIAAVTLVGAIGWGFGKDVTEWAIFASPVFTLGSAATAFYFGSAESSD